MPDLPPALPPVAKPWGFWATLGLSAVALGVFLLTQTLVSVMVLTQQASQNAHPNNAVSGATANGFVLSIATIAAAPLATALMIGFIRLRRQIPVSTYLALKKPSSEELLKWILVTVIFVVTTDLLKSLVDRPIVPAFVTEIYQTAGNLAVFYLATAIAAPMFEEVLFRGFLFQGIRNSSLGSLGAIVLPAAVWSLLHVQYVWYDVLGILGFGLLLGIAQQRTKSLFVPIAMHVLNNLLAVLQVAWQIK